MRNENAHGESGGKELAKEAPVSAMGIFKVAALVSSTGLAGLTIALFWFLFTPGEQSPEAATRSEMVSVAQALAHYRSGCHQLPTTEQGLAALLAPPPRGPRCAEVPSVILTELPRDAWAHPFQYVSDGKEFTLTSYGQDGKEGGEGKDADIVYRGTP